MMIRYSEKAQAELMAIMGRYTALDPKGEWNDEEWAAYLKANASAETLHEVEAAQIEHKKARSMGIRI